VGRFGAVPAGVTALRPWLGWTTAGAGLALTASLGIGVCLLFPPALAAPAAVSVVMFGAALMGAGLLLVWRLPRPAFRTVVCGLWAAFVVGTTTFLPAFGRARPIHDVADRLRAHQ